MGRKPADGAWMRRFTTIALVAVVMTTFPTTSADAGEAGNGPFLLSRPTLSWPCAPQAVHIDVGAAPSSWHVDVVRAALARFRSATGRAWPATTDPDAPIQIRWYDPGGHEGALTVLGADDEHYRGADVQLSPKLRPAWLYSTVLHELGHVGGLAHVSDPVEVMGLYPNEPHDRYAVGDLVGLLLANRSCTAAAAFRARAAAARP
jgi:hypothetical protein